MSNVTVSSSAHLNDLRLPVLPAGYRWNIRPDQGDGEFQLYREGSTLLITIDRITLGGILSGFFNHRATGSRGYYVNSASTSEHIEATALDIFQRWQTYLARQPVTR